VNERLPPGQDPPDDLDDRYRRDSMRDPSRPSERVRRAVLEHAAQLAAERALKNPSPRIDFRQPAANQARWRTEIVGALAAAALAGLLVAPYFLMRAPEPASEPAQAPPAAALSASPSAAVSPAAPAPQLQIAQDRGEAAKASSAPQRAAPRQGPATASEPRGATADNYAPSESPRAAEAARTGPIAAPSARSAARSLAAPMPEAAPAPPTAPAPRSAATAETARADPAAALRRSAEIGDLAAMQALLATQTDVDARDSNGRTALLLAILHGHAQAVDALLARGADPNLADMQGLTPLQAALAGNQPAIAVALQRAGAR